MDIITINYGCNVRWEADKKWCLGIHLALVNLPVAASSWSPIQTDYFMPDLLDAWEGERAAVFYPLSSLLPPEREKSMGGHREAIGYVCVGEKQAQLTWALFISALRSPHPRGPERAAHTGRIASAPTHHFRASRNRTVAAQVCFVVFLYIIFAAEMSQEWAMSLTFRSLIICMYVVELITTNTHTQTHQYLWRLFSVFKWWPVSLKTFP